MDPLTSSGFQRQGDLAVEPLERLNQGGLADIIFGMKIICNETLKANCCCCRKDREECDTVCFTLGFCLLGIGLWKLRAPIIGIGVSSYALSYSWSWLK